MLLQFTHSLHILSDFQNISFILHVTEKLRLVRNVRISYTKNSIFLDVGYLNLYQMNVVDSTEFCVTYLFCCVNLNKQNDFSDSVHYKKNYILRLFCNHLSYVPYNVSMQLKSRK